MRNSPVNSLRIIESVEDDFVFQRAFVAEEDGVLVPRAEISGVLCNIETKPGPLKDGLAFCQPLNVAPDHWPNYVRVERPTAEGQAYAETLWNFTAKPRVVAAARRFNDLVNQGSVTHGDEL